MHVFHRCRRLAGLACALYLVLAPAAGAAPADPLAQAEALLRAGHPAEALQVLQPLEPQRAGEPAYDILLGISALRAGNAALASLALERAVAVDPASARARFALAQALAALGDAAGAQALLDWLLAQQPPAPDRRVLEQALRQLGAAAPAAGTTAYLELSAGRSTNVNDASADAVVAVPVLINALFRLDPLNVAIADNYLGAAAGVNLEHALDGSLGLYAGADLRGRLDAHATAFNTTDLTARAGLQGAAGGGQLRAGLLAEDFGLGGQVNRNTVGINADWRRPLGAGREAGLFGQVAVNRFPDPVLRPNDFDQAYLGVSLQQALAGGDVQVYGSAYGGGEASPHGRTDGPRAFAGVRAGFSARCTPAVDAWLHAGWQHSSYSWDNAVFLVNRADRVADVTAGVTARLGGDWSLRPQLQWVRADSNVPIDQFERWDVSLTVRREFR